MPIRLKKFWLLSLILLPGLACNAFAGRQAVFLPPPATLTPELESGVDISEPQIAPTVTLPGDSTPLPAQGTVRILVDLNIRSGPGVQFNRIGFLPQGDVVQVIGRDQQTGWWQIPCPTAVTSPQCWISGGARYTRIESMTPTP